MEGARCKAAAYCGREHQRGGLENAHAYQIEKRRYSLENRHVKERSCLGGASGVKERGARHFISTSPLRSFNHTNAAASKITIRRSILTGKVAR
jgi:hypothetical protein